MTHDDDRLRELFAEACDMDPEARETLIERVRAESPELGAALAALLLADEEESAEGEEVHRWLEGLAEEQVSADSAGLAAVAIDLTELHALRPVRERYEIGVEIGRGGMGSVHRTWDEALRREVARKTFDAGDCSERTRGTLLARFLNEARLTAGLEHPGIVPVHDAGVDDDGNPFFTMQRIEGRELGAVMDLARESYPADFGRSRVYREPREGWNARRFLEVLLRICDIVAYAHAHGVIHRDLKPSNIMVGAFGEVYVLDWSHARRLDEVETPEGSSDEAHSGLTTSGKVIGTPPYLAPEQARGQAHEADQRADVYALGTILYEWLCAHPPYHNPESLRGSPNRMIEAIALGHPHYPTPSELEGQEPTPLGAVCRRAMEHAPDARYPSVDAFAADIRAYLEHRPTSVEDAGTGRRIALWCRRHPALTTITVLVVAFVTTVFTLTYRNAEQSARAMSVALGRSALLEAGTLGGEVRALSDGLRAVAEPLDAGREISLDALSGLATALSAIARREPLPGPPPAAGSRSVAAFSRDGRHLATVSSHGVVELRSANDLELLASIELILDPYRTKLAIEFHASGNWLWVRYGETVNLLAVPDLEVLGHRDVPQTAHVTSRGDELVVIDEGDVGRIQLVSTSERDGYQLRVIAETGMVASIEQDSMLSQPPYSENRRLIAATGGRYVAWLWGFGDADDPIRDVRVEAENESEFERWHTLEWPRPVHALALSEDGKYLAALDIERLSVIDLAAGERLLVDEELPASLDLARAGSHRVAFSPDGSVVAVVTARRVLGFGTARGDVLFDVEGPGEITHAEFAADSTRLLVSGHRDAAGASMSLDPPELGLVQAIDTASGALRTFSVPGVPHAVPSHDGDAFVVTDQMRGTVYRVVVDGHRAREARAPETPTHMLLSQDGSWVWTVHEDEPRLRSYDTEGLALRKVHEVSAPVLHAFLSPDGEHLIAVCEDLALRLFSAQETPPIAVLANAFGQFDGYAIEPMFTPDSGYLIYPRWVPTDDPADSGRYRLVAYSLRERRELAELPVSYREPPMGVLLSGSHIAVPHPEGGRIEIYDFPDWNAEAKTFLWGDTRADAHALFEMGGGSWGHAMIQGESLLSSDGRGSLEIRTLTPGVEELAPGVPLPTTRAPVPGVSRVAIGPEGERIAASHLSSLSVRTAATWETPTVATSTSTGRLRFSPSGELLAEVLGGENDAHRSSASAGAAVRLYDTDTLILIDTLPHPEMTDFAFSPDGRRVVTVGGGLVRTWPLAADALIDEAIQRLRRYDDGAELVERYGGRARGE